MNRRTFLKMCATFAGGVAAATTMPKFRAIENIFMPEYNEAWFGSIRVLNGYDIELGKGFVRYDIFAPNKNIQSYVTFLQPNEPITKKEFLGRYHRPAITALRNHMIHKKILPIDLEPLPVPLGASSGYGIKFIGWN